MGRGDGEEQVISVSRRADGEAYFGAQKGRLLLSADKDPSFSTAELLALHRMEVALRTLNNALKSDYAYQDSWNSVSELSAAEVLYYNNFYKPNNSPDPEQIALTERQLVKLSERGIVQINDKETPHKFAPVQSATKQLADFNVQIGEQATLRSGINDRFVTINETKVSKNKLVNELNNMSFYAKLGKKHSATVDGLQISASPKMFRKGVKISTEQTTIKLSPQEAVDTALMLHNPLNALEDSAQ